MPFDPNINIDIALQCTVEKARAVDTAGFYATPEPVDAKRPSARIPELRGHSAWNAMDEEIDGNLGQFLRHVIVVRLDWLSAHACVYTIASN